MKFIVNLIAKITGIEAATKKLDGFNTKAAGIAAVLSGVAALIAQWVGMPHDAATILAFVKGFAMNPAWLSIIAGWGALGLGNKMEKAKEVAANTPTVVITNAKEELKNPQ